MHLRAIEPLREFGTRPLPEFDPKPMIAALNEHGVRYVVIGAVAAIAQGYPLNTGPDTRAAATWPQPNGCMN